MPYASAHTARTIQRCLADIGGPTRETRELQGSRGRSSGSGISGKSPAMRSCEIIQPQTLQMTFIGGESGILNGVLNPCGTSVLAALVGGSRRVPFFQLGALV